MSNHTHKWHFHAIQSTLWNQPCHSNLDFNLPNGGISQKYTLRWAFKSEWVSRKQKHFLLEAKSNLEWSISHLGNQNVLTRISKAKFWKSSSLQCQPMFKYPYKYFLFVDALQGPACWSWLKPEKSFLTLYSGEKWGYSNIHSLFSLRRTTMFSVYFRLLIGIYSKNLGWNVVMKGNSICLEPLFLRNRANSFQNLQPNSQTCPLLWSQTWLHHISHFPHTVI